MGRDLENEGLPVIIPGLYVHHVIATVIRLLCSLVKVRGRPHEPRGRWEVGSGIILRLNFRDMMILIAARSHLIYPFYLRHLSHHDVTMSFDIAHVPQASTQSSSPHEERRL